MWRSRCETTFVSIEQAVDEGAQGRLNMATVGIIEVQPGHRE